MPLLVYATELISWLGFYSFMYSLMICYLFTIIVCYIDLFLFLLSVCCYSDKSPKSWSIYKFHASNFDSFVVITFLEILSCVSTCSNNVRMDMDSNFDHFEITPCWYSQVIALLDFGLCTKRHAANEWHTLLLSCCVYIYTSVMLQLIY